METESSTFLNQLRLKHDNHANVLNHVGTEHSDGIKIKLRALLVALLGVSMSACAFASQPVELELDDDDVAQKLNNVSFARRITKPTIRLVMGYGKLSAFVTATTSLLLLVAVMSKQSWWRRGARWLAAPALLVAALETASDASDAMLAAVLRGSAEPARVAIQTAAAALLITVEILVWYFIAKFFEYNPPATAEEREKENLMMRAMPQ
uniref:SFRICE_010386 n=1 Tax=Spodoptera frugiperda TaxID=7108 RepID=A0A2H1WN43_SPOFR